MEALDCNETFSPTVRYVIDPPLLSHISVRSESKDGVRACKEKVH